VREGEGEEGEEEREEAHCCGMGGGAVMMGDGGFGLGFGMRFGWMFALDVLLRTL